MGSIEKRGENTWRVGFRRSVADGRGWVRKTLSFPADMPEAEQRKACEVELARLIVQEADGRQTMTAPSQADVLALIEKYTSRRRMPRSSAQGRAASAGR